MEEKQAHLLINDVLYIYIKHIKNITKIHRRVPKVDIRWLCYILTFDSPVSVAMEKKKKQQNRQLCLKMIKWQRVSNMNCVGRNMWRQENIQWRMSSTTLVSRRRQSIQYTCHVVLCASKSRPPPSWWAEFVSVSRERTTKKWASLGMYPNVV